MYGDIDGLKLKIGFQAAIMEAGETDEGAFDDALKAILTAASDVVDNYISARYDAGDYESNALLTRVAYAIACYDAFTQYARDQVPETVRLDKEEALRTLEKIAGGLIQLSPDSPDEDAPEPVSSEFESADQVFTTVLM